MSKPFRSKFARYRNPSLEEQRERHLRSLVKERVEKPLSDEEIAIARRGTEHALGSPNGVGSWSQTMARWPDGPGVMRRESTERGFYRELSRYNGDEE